MNRPLILMTGLALLNVLALSSKPAAAADLSIEIHNVTASEGSLGIQLLDDQGFSGKTQPLAAQLAAPKEPVSSLTFPNVAPGRYALRVMHDKNANGKLDTNLLGIPTEPYGFSNDAAGSFGPPDFEAAAFEVGDAPLHVKVTLQ